MNRGLVNSPTKSIKQLPKESIRESPEKAIVPEIRPTSVGNNNNNSINAAGHLNREQSFSKSNQNENQSTASPQMRRKSSTSPKNKDMPSFATTPGHRDDPVGGSTSPLQPRRSHHNYGGGSSVERKYQIDRKYAPDPAWEREELLNSIDDIYNATRHGIGIYI